MIRIRRAARTFVRLSLPLAVLAFAGMPGTAQATPETSCEYGFYTLYYDDLGNVCAANDTCNNSYWGSCDNDLTYASEDETMIVCYCDPR